MTQVEFDNLMNSIRQEQSEQTSEIRKEIKNLQERRYAFKAAYDEAWSEYKNLGKMIEAKNTELKNIGEEFYNRKKALIQAFPKAQGTPTDNNTKAKQLYFRLRQRLIEELREIYKDVPTVCVDSINVLFQFDDKSVQFTANIPKLVAEDE